jgi:hypothetical protein
VKGSRLAYKSSVSPLKAEKKTAPEPKKQPARKSSAPSKKKKEESESEEEVDSEVLSGGEGGWVAVY